MRKEMKKKIVALLLSCLLVLSGIPAALALESPEEQGPEMVSYDGARSMATGDLSLTKEVNPKGPVISSIADYYKAANSSRLRSASSALPAKVDNSQSRFFPEIGDQGRLGSCASWAQTYYQFTYTMNKALNRPSTPENCFSPKWTYNLVNGGTDTGSSCESNYEVLNNQGAATMSQVPYDTDYLSWSPENEIWSGTSDYRLKDYQYLSVGLEHDDTPITNPRDEDLGIIKTALSNGEVLTFSTYMYGWMYSKISRRTEVPENADYAGENIAIGLSSMDGGHRMTIVGYNDDLWVDINGDNIVQEQEKGAFKVANSWGDSYMMNDGFIWVSYDALNRVSAILEPGTSNRIDCPIFSLIARIDVEPYDSDSGIVLRYTLNSNNRGTTRVNITAEKDGTLYSALVTPYKEVHSFFDNYSYDGTTDENDGFMCCDLDRVVENLDSENFRDYNWTVTFTDNETDASVFTVKEATIVDNNTGKTYTSGESTPFALNGAKKTLSFYQSDRKAAVVYYRGFLNPYICYKTGDGQWTQQPGVPMERSDEMEGYTHKYAIELSSDTETAAVCFTDGKGNWDDNGGAYYTLGDGFHKIITEDVDIEPLTITSFTTQLEDNTASTNQKVIFKSNVQGGYEPYQYQFTAVNTVTGESGQANIYESGSYTEIYFRGEGIYKVTVKVTDVAGSTAEKSSIVTVKNKPAVFTSFTADSQSPAYVGNKITFSGTTLYEQLNMPFGNKFSLFILKDGKTVAEPAVTIKKLDDSIMSTTVRAVWTPTEAGNYTAQIIVTDKIGVTATAKIFLEVRDLDTATIYYKGYGSPNIHYQAGNGAWTAVPGIAMTPINDVEGYTHKYTIPLNGASYANVCFNDGNNSWDSNNGKNYRFTAGTYGFESGTITPLDLTTLRIADFKLNTDETETFVYGKIAGFNASALGGYSPYEFQFGLKNPDGTIKWDTEYSANDFYYFMCYEKGNFTAFVNVKDATGAISTETMDIEIKGMEITEFAVSQETVPTATELLFTGTTIHELYYMGNFTHSLTIKKDGVTVETLDMKSVTTYPYNNLTASWTPQEAGNYTAELYVEDSYGQTASKTLSFTVTENKPNSLTIYYKGYTDPNIHYQVGNGAWTDVPGVKMAQTNEVSGYTHKYTIDLEGAEFANVCFNDGNGNWDSQNGANYQFKAGTYGYSGGTITPLDLTKPKVTRLTASCGDGSPAVGKTISLNAAAEGGTAPYEYQFGLLDANGTEKWVTQYSQNSSCDFTTYEGGNYKAFVNVKDANGVVGTKTIDLKIEGLEIISFTASPEIGTVGTEMVFTARTVNEQFSYGPNIHGLAIKKGDKPVVSSTFDCTQDGQYTVHTAKWTPQEAGNYTVRFYMEDAKGQKAEKTIEVTVLEKASNTLTIYYKGYDNPNIHYQVGDSAWTNVPGVKMAASNDLSGYTHKYTIDLGDAQYANVCFNDGNGNWDSQNGFNYRFEAGVYTYQNGIQTKIS